MCWGAMSAVAWVTKYPLRLWTQLLLLLILSVPGLVGANWNLDELRTSGSARQIRHLKAFWFCLQRLHAIVRDGKWQKRCVVRPFVYCKWVFIALSSLCCGETPATIGVLAFAIPVTCHMALWAIRHINDWINCVRAFGNHKCVKLMLTQLSSIVHKFISTYVYTFGKVNLELKLISIIYNILLWK